MSAPLMLPQAVESARKMTALASEVEEVAAADERHLVRDIERVLFVIGIDRPPPRPYSSC